MDAPAAALPGLTPEEQSNHANMEKHVSRPATQCQASARGKAGEAQQLPVHAAAHRSNLRLCCRAQMRRFGHTFSETTKRISAIESCTQVRNQVRQKQRADCKADKGKRGAMLWDAVQGHSLGVLVVCAECAVWRIG